MNDSDKMPISFKPNYSISAETASALMQIESVRRDIDDLPITPSVLASLRETARLYSTHYSTMIEGNQLMADDVAKVIEGSGHFPGRERDEKEVKGYYAAIEQLERHVQASGAVSESIIGKLHALVMAGGRIVKTPTSYRDGQNVIRNSADGAIVYMPPESPDVSRLMSGLVEWVNNNAQLPVPLLAGIAHYQFATIHPWYDGNGRTARLLTTLILHLGGYGLKGLYALEEYYARDLGAYYKALSLGPSHNYYMGRAEADITPWIDYFIFGMRTSFAKVKTRAQEAAQDGQQDRSDALRTLDPKQRKVLILFQDKDEVTSKDIEELFELQPRTARVWCARWIEQDFIMMSNSSRKARKYRLAEKYQHLI